MKNREAIALIPARGGSKGLPNKNIRELFGKPLIAWTIIEAKKSPHIKKIIVSTDSKKIARIAKCHGADEIILRPKSLATDKSKMIDTVIHAVKYLSKNRHSFEIIVLLQPTSPLRKAMDVDKAIRLLSLNNAMSIVSVCEVDDHPLFANTLPSDGRMNNFLTRNIERKNRQELPTYYKLNGAIYLARIDYIKKEKSFYGKQTFAYIMPKERSIDIDNELDFIKAEIILSRQARIK